MNKEWSDLNKSIQANLTKESSFNLGINSLLELRKQIKETIEDIYNTSSINFFYSLPLKSDKTIAYYVWHMARIEDITSNTLISNSSQVFFEKKFDDRINSQIITTGNELRREQLDQFSRKLNINELYKYFIEVHENTNKILGDLTYKDLKTPISEERKKDLISLNVVSNDEDAFWLVDYWCNKNYLGLILMPFSRHLIMHTEGCLRIYNKLIIKSINNEI